MNRTDRLYALVEELRAAAPRHRTVQRDLPALLAAGVPVRAVPGRGGGWAIDPAMTLPPIRFTAEEASALAVALAAAPNTGAARSALQKIAASLSGPASDAARALAARIVALPSPAEPAVRRNLADLLDGAAAGAATPATLDPLT